MKPLAVKSAINTLGELTVMWKAVFTTKGQTSAMQVKYV